MMQCPNEARAPPADNMEVWRHEVLGERGRVPVPAVPAKCSFNVEVRVCMSMAQKPAM